MSTTHTTNEDLKASLDKAHVFEWGFKLVLTALLSLLCFLGANLTTDVKKLPVDLAEKIAIVIDRIQRLEAHVAEQDATKLPISEWAHDRGVLEVRLASDESREAVLENKLDTLSADLKHTADSVDRMETKLTGFQIDFQKYRK